MRAFEFHKNTESKCKYRISQEACNVLSKFISEKRILTLEKKDFLMVLNNEYTKPEDYKDETIREKLKNMEIGSCLIKLKDTKIVIVAMKCIATLVKFIQKDKIPFIKQQIED